VNGRKEGASLSRTALRDRYRGWLQHHRLSAAESLVKVLENPLSSLLTWLVIGIALALPVGLDAALDNLDRLGGSWDSPAQVSLFMAADLDEAAVADFAAALARRDGIDAASFISREIALAEFSASSGLTDVLESLGNNPLPHVVLVTPAADLDSLAVQSLRDELAGSDQVTEAVLDMAWLQRLQGLMAVGNRLVFAVGGMLVLGVVLILGNTIRLAIENRRDEIVIVKLVGGSNAFVRRPFLYTGLWYGVGGGLLAGLLVSAALWFLAEPVARVAALYGSHFALVGPGLMGVLNLVILGGLLGLAGAWVAVARHLSQIEPR
jgi:cell division transport system permease protein